MLNSLAAITVVLTGLYFVGLAGAALVAPLRAERFLLGFASSAFAHYLELALRLAVGGAFLVHAPRMAFPRAFGVVGWTLVLTTAFLAVVPWTWHRRFARWAVPYALRNLKLLGIASLALGAGVLAAVIHGMRY